MLTAAEWEHIDRGLLRQRPTAMIFPAELLYREKHSLRNSVPAGVFKFQLAIDELLNNVISYAFKDASDPVIKVLLHFTDAAVTAVIQDNGRPFNPLKDALTPDLALFR